MRARFLLFCAGYYSYAQGWRPPFPGEERFKGPLVHPQFWPEGLSYSGQRVVVIGSGATAVTLVPEMAKTAAHVTMLQRSPTYVVSRPAEDTLANWMRKWLPAKLAYGITRWRNVLMGAFFYNTARKKPEKTKEGILKLARKQLPEGYDLSHFTPRYNPWDQRMCLIPDADLFESIKQGKSEVVTDEIETFTETGLKLKSGKVLSADLVVTATGLDLLFLGGMQVSVDGAPVDMCSQLTYKGMMYSGVPNLASVFGYTNASWTLKADLTCEYVCRLLNYMDANKVASATPRNTDPTVTTEPWLDFSSGYVQRTISRFPKQGSKMPWRLNQNYFRDIKLLRRGKLEDGILQFEKAGAKAKVKEPA